MVNKNAVKVATISFNPLTRNDALNEMFSLSASDRTKWVVTSNLDHLVIADTNHKFRDAIHQSDLIVSDGWPIVMVLRLIGYKFSQRITGSDFMPLIAERAGREGKSIFIMGGLDGWAEEAADVLRKKFPGLNVCGTYCPPFGFEKSGSETQKMIDLINQAKPDFFFLGVGSPKQEIWIGDHIGKIHCGMIIGVGATIGFVAGRIQRAPWIFKKFGLEWFYRFCQEPGRLGPRYAKDLLMLPRLAAQVVRHHLSPKGQ
jgi:N-acetylglucosaminyldiphosphoundecaprenol N-acetyl-beta-D-mannosaminyltransferase